MKTIKLSQPQIGFREKYGVLRVLNSGNLAQGKKVQEFENLFSRLHDDLHCIAVNSGTSALHLSLLALGIKAGDEILVPSFSFAASANAISLTGATPVFCDIDTRTFNILASDVEKKINQRTRAILVVHLYGLPANMTELTNIAEKNNLLLVEDAAQAHLTARRKGPAHPRRAAG